MQLYYPFDNRFFYKTSFYQITKFLSFTGDLIIFLPKYQAANELNPKVTPIIPNISLIDLNFLSPLISNRISAEFRQSSRL